MNTLKNTVRLIGRLGKDPEIKVLEKGNKLAKFSLATGSKYKGKDGQFHEDTQWHNLVVWGNLAGVCEKNLHKGKEIAIEGKLMYRNWQSNDGSMRISTEILVNEILFIDDPLPG